MVVLDERVVTKIFDTLCEYAIKIGEKPDDVINSFLDVAGLIMEVSTFNEYKG